jgi:signal transduction histidine kinase
LQESERRVSEARHAAGIRLLTMLGLCVILAMAVARFSIVQTEGLESATKRQYEEMTKLSARLLDLEEEHRKRLSRELHDEIGQTLALLEIEISHATALAGERQDELRNRLAHARTLVENIVQTVRNITLLLRPALLDDLGLAPALEWLVEDFTRRSGVACELAAENVEERLPDSVKTCIYRIVQEALHNCEKHAGASKATVRVHGSEEAMAIEIEDNGRGFEAPPRGSAGPNAGLGILGMRERAARVGGTVTLVSSPGKGTRIGVIIPLAGQTGKLSARGAVKV